MRPAPKGWTRARWPVEVIEMLKNENVTEISLDHDLADAIANERTGYDVLLWLEKQVVENNFKPPIIHIHTSNPAARKKMKLAADNIKRLYGKET